MIRVTLLVFVLLLFLAVVNSNSGGKLVRQRREWFPPPKELRENVKHNDDFVVTRIRSDFDDGKMDIQYSLEGIGANQAPFHVFVVDPKTGEIRVTRMLDRELISQYNLSAVAKYSNGIRAEKDTLVCIKVIDENDNTPVFAFNAPQEVDELSPRETSVMKVTATDADEPGNENSQIAYSIIDQKPPHDMFYMTSDGSIHVKKPSLDRELQDQYILTVRGADLNGKPGGNTGTGTVTINIRDVNDNLPTLEKDEYEGTIEENTAGVEVIRIKAEDLDLKDTENWEAVFDIVKGNEAEYFSITTDPKTNEGILMLDKPVDYEDVKNITLGILVKNKAPPYVVPSGASLPATYAIKINVKNQPEGAAFDPKVKAIPISEGDHSININDVIARYPAIDGDTGKPAENVKYAKGSDPDNWLTIDPETAEIKLNKMPDRESPHLVNGTYYAKVLCISQDMPAKTATGTIAIQVEDFNDHCPTLTSNIQTMCTTDDAVIVNAVDEDAFPNGAPFDFVIIPEGTNGKWQAEHLNDTAAILRAQESMWPGIYEVEFVVRDQQAEACPEPQKVSVTICTCEDGVVCGKRGFNGQPSKGIEFGPAGIGLLLLGLLLLLLIPLLLLFCQCGGIAGLPGIFTEMPFDATSHLINYHTEGQGENTEVPLMTMPSKVDGNGVQIGMIKNVTASAESTGATNWILVDKNVDFLSGHGEHASGMINETFYPGSDARESGVGGLALQYHFLGQYYTQKATSRNKNDEKKDSLLIYDYEGEGSLDGSMGCCSILETDNDLQFLDDLGPKFKTLAEVCGGKKIPTEVKQVLTDVPSASISTHSSGSALITAQNSQIVKESTATVREGMTTLKEGDTNQGQVLLLQQQQPIYYTTTPVLQPMHYVVQPQVQNTMLLAEGPVTNMQGMVVVNGTQSGPTQGVIVQGQTLMSGGQAQVPGMVLLKSNTVQRGSSNLIHTGNLCGSQTMMVVEGKVPAGSIKALKGSQSSLLQGGTLHSGGLSRSQSVMVVNGAPSSGGQLVQETRDVSQSDVSGSQKVLYSKARTSAVSQSSMVGSSTTTMSTTPLSHMVVVQETAEIH